MKINFKNFGFLDFLVSASAIFVVGMLIWTASTRPAVEAKANLVKENHKKVVDFINNENVTSKYCRVSIHSKSYLWNSAS